MSTRRRRKCRNCGELFRPDPRNVRHQRYCSASACRRASKAASQRRWLSKAANREYFGGPEQVARVRAWREAHPGYARNRSRGRGALQEHSSVQPIDNNEQSEVFSAPALQEVSRSQVLVLTGLIAHLTGAALQEDIACTSRKLQQLALDLTQGDREGGTVHATYYHQSGPSYWIADLMPGDALDSRVTPGGDLRFREAGGRDVEWIMTPHFGGLSMQYIRNGERSTVRLAKTDEPVCLSRVAPHPDSANDFRGTFRGTWPDGQTTEITVVRIDDNGDVYGTYCDRSSRHVRHFLFNLHPTDGVAARLDAGALRFELGTGKWAFRIDPADPDVVRFAFRGDETRELDPERADEQTCASRLVQLTPPATAPRRATVAEDIPDDPDH